MVVIFMDMNFYEKLLGYYKGKIEDDEKYEKRIQKEEKDTYRVMKAVNGGSQQLGIKNLGDLVCLINVSRQLTISGGRNIFEEFMAIPQIEETINSENRRNPKLIQAIQGYDFCEWEHFETPLEHEHTQIEEFKRFNTESDYRDIFAVVKSFIDNKKTVVIKTAAKSEQELTYQVSSIIAISKMIMRLDGFVPSSKLKFEDGNVYIIYKEADKVFGDTSRENGLVMVPTPVEIEEEEKQKEHRTQREKLEREQQQKEYEKTMLERWSKTPEQKQETEQQKKKHEQTMQERWGLQKKRPQSRISKPMEQHSQNKSNGISR